MVGLYLGMAVVGTDESTDTDGSVDVAANGDDNNGPEIDLSDAASDATGDADVVARLDGKTVSGGIDPAGPSSSSTSTSTATTSTTAPSTSPTTPASAVPVSEAPTTAPTVAPVPDPGTPDPAAPDPAGPDPSTPGPSVTDPATTAPEQASSSTTTPLASTPSTPSTTAPATTAPSTAPPTTETAPTTQPPVAGLDAVEQEILRLTNELRANPAGPLARQKPMPSCVNDPFYGISIDGATGHPATAPALSIDVRVSAEMSRPWAVDMDSRNTLQHRSNGSQLEIYERLGISIAATGENIAWFSGYPDEQAARIHFEGWRESDTGHYCAMVSSTYANIGVGHFKGATRSWAVQNFYSTR